MTDAERQEAIRQVEEEIDWISRSYCCDEKDNCAECPIAKRILAREQAALAELRKGMRQ